MLSIVPFVQKIESFVFCNSFKLTLWTYLKHFHCGKYAVRKAKMCLHLEPICEDAFCFSQKSNALLL